MRMFALLLPVWAMMASQAANAATCSAPACQPPQKIKVLFEVGGPCHDQPELYQALKERLQATEQYVVTITDDRDYFVSPNIDAFDVVIIYTTDGALTEAQERGLIQFVENGKGVIGIHSATDSFKNSDAYWKLMCGRFVSHGSGTFDVKITAKSHAVVGGIQAFSITDETYKNEFHKDAKPIVVMRRVEDGEPVSWVQYYGKGRVFCTGLGHGPEAWGNPAFQHMITQALAWTTGRINP